MEMLLLGHVRILSHSVCSVASSMYVDRVGHLAGVPGAPLSWMTHENQVTHLGGTKLKLLRLLILPPASGIIHSS